MRGNLKTVNGSKAQIFSFRIKKIIIMKVECVNSRRRDMKYAHTLTIPISSAIVIRSISMNLKRGNSGSVSYRFARTWEQDTIFGCIKCVEKRSHKGSYEFESRYIHKNS